MMKKFKILTALSALFMAFNVNAKNVTFHTNMGDITVEVDEKNAPVSSQNFIDYAQNSFYNGTIFHRVIDGFMIQGGGFDAEMNQKKANAPIKNEANNGLKNMRGTIAMARTSDPHSASSQFFINLKDNDFLNFTGETKQGWGYAVFGKVTQGMNVVDQIAKVKTGRSGMHGDVPVEAVVIKSVTVK